MNKEHTCVPMSEYQKREELENLTLKKYEIGGWELEWNHFRMDSSQIDEFNFCPYCGEKLE